MLPLPEAPRTPPRNTLDPALQESSWTARQKEEGPESRYRWTTPQAASIVSLATPLSAGHRGKCVHGSSWAHYSAQVSDRCDSGQNKTHAFSKTEQKYLSAYHKRPALMQPICTAVSTPCHVGRGLAGHPRCVNVGKDYSKTRLYTPIRLLATTVCSENAQVLHAEVMNLLEKGAIEIVAPAQSESGFYNLIPRPQKRWRPATYSRSQTPELRLDEKVVQDDHFETDPPANMPRGLVHVAGSERRVLSHPGSPPSQTILEIRIRRGGISIQGPAVWAILGSLPFYMMHGCGSLPSATDGNPHTQLPRQRAHSGPVAGGFYIAQDPPPLRLPGAQGQLCQDHTVTQPTCSWAQLSTHMTECIWQQLSQRNGDSDLCISPGPLEGPLQAKVRRDLRHGTQKEGCHDRSFQQGLGSAVRGKTDFRPVVRRGVNSSCRTFRDTMC